MVNFEEMVDLMGLTFFCNSMVEGLYYMKKKNSVCEKLEENCKRVITEFEGLKWPLVEKTYPAIETRLFKTNLNFQTLQNVLSENYGEWFSVQSLDRLIKSLKYILSENPINERVKTAEELQRFFDCFGDYSFYAIRECVRC